MCQEQVSLGEGYLKKPFVLRKGYLDLPTGPWSGIELDENAMASRIGHDWKNRELMTPTMDQSWTGETAWFIVRQGNRRPAVNSVDNLRIPVSIGSKPGSFAMNHLLILVFTTLLPSLAQESCPWLYPRSTRSPWGAREAGIIFPSIPTRWLHVSRGNRVVVLDLDKETVVGELAGTPGIHGIAVVPELGKGFTSNGSDSSVTVFDLKTLKATGKIKASGVPDALLYDPASKRAITFNHRTNDGTSIDPATEKVAGTIAFGGEPEAAVADGKGHIFVNIRSASEIAEFDALTLKVLNRWVLAPGTRPNGLAIDVKNSALIAAATETRRWS